MPRGQYNSSITRVRPVFGRLIRRDPSGNSWLRALLATVAEGQPEEDLIENPGEIYPHLTDTRPYLDSVLADHGVPEIDLERCFEMTIPPPSAFLEWLIRNPNSLSWPLRGGEETRYGPATQVKREQLVGRRTRADADEARKEALDQLAVFGPEGSKRQWWAFEGFTDVDCYIETDKLVLVIEGKRTEGLSKSTNWYPLRSQLARNLEVAAELAGDRKATGVLLAVESDGFDVSLNEIELGLPHLEGDDLGRVTSRLFGPVTWRSICEATSLDFADLPDTTELVAASLRSG